MMDDGNRGNIRASEANQASSMAGNIRRASKWVQHAPASVARELSDATQIYKVMHHGIWLDIWLGHGVMHQKSQASYNDSCIKSLG